MLVFDSDLQVAPIFEGDDPRFETVERGTWVSDGKYEHCETIVKEITSGQHYRLTVSRSGSSFTEYYYMFDRELLPVKQKEITVTVWVTEV